MAAYSKATHCSRYLAKNLVHTEALRVGSKPTGDATCHGRGGALLSIHSTLQIARLRARYVWLLGVSNSRGLSIDCRSSICYNWCPRQNRILIWFDKLQWRWDRDSSTCTVPWVFLVFSRRVVLRLWDARLGQLSEVPGKHHVEWLEESDSPIVWRQLMYAGRVVITHCLS